MSSVELLSAQGFRNDGRRPHELRRIQCKIGVLSAPDGSSYIEQGNTKVLCAVYGPRKIRGGGWSKAQHDKAVVNCEYSMATFSAVERRRRPKGDRRSQEMSMNLQQAFEAAILTSLYPQSEIDIYFTVLQADGGQCAACINAGTLALVDAGVAIRNYVCACNAGFVNEMPLVDINHLEESLGNTALTVAILSNSEDIVLQEMTARLHRDHFVKVLDAAIKGCLDIYAVLDATIRNQAGKRKACLKNSSNN